MEKNWYLVVTINVSAWGFIVSFVKYVVFRFKTKYFSVFIGHVFLYFLYIQKLLSCGYNV